MTPDQARALLELLADLYRLASIPEPPVSNTEAVPEDEPAG